MSTVKIRNEFNRKAEALGCKARIGGTGKKPAFYMLLYIASDGHEVIAKITPDQFGKLINNYPELHG